MIRPERRKKLSPTEPACSGRRGFTLIELLVVVAVVALLASLILPALAGAKRQAAQRSCVNNLHDIGVGFRLFASDHNGRFPMDLSTNAGGTAEFLPSPSSGIALDAENSFRHYRALGRLISPKILVCPADMRTSAPAMAALEQLNVSYHVWVNPLPAPRQSSSILTADRNFSGARMLFTPGLHAPNGNLLFADGHVEQRRSDTQFAFTDFSDFSKATINRPGAAVRAHHKKARLVQ